MTDASSHDVSLTIRRTINAPQQRVFEAWTQEEHLKHWWRCNPAWKTDLAEVDLKVGGNYRLSMHDPEAGQSHVCRGEFREIDPPRKVVYTWFWEPPGMEMDETLVTVEFLEQGDSTEIVLTHEHFPGSAAANEHNQGWNLCIDVLQQWLESE